ncbi:hypothetical protein NE237_027300 [Protea cynaroides]|uniref:Protein kinase domain-containing protein n=1 Tax=Protea cynaroides TaxID=273540 RepID=A0A9Q0GPV8_9MAGN|nr:hypothetical protein NE237_027300 [Protea cynaroides]
MDAALKEEAMTLHLVSVRSGARDMADHAKVLILQHVAPWRVFMIEELSHIRKNFSDGTCLFGDAKTTGTYSGFLRDGSRVTVKRLKKSIFLIRRNFIPRGIIASLCHPNLVAVKGCCYNRDDHNTVL